MRQVNDEFFTNSTFSITKSTTITDIQDYKLETFLDVLQNRSLSYPAKVLYSYLFAMIFSHNLTNIAMPYRVIKHMLGISKQQFYNDRNILEVLGYIRASEIKRENAGRPNKERIELIFELPESE